MDPALLRLLHCAQMDDLHTLGELLEIEASLETLESSELSKKKRQKRRYQDTEILKKRSQPGYQSDAQILLKDFHEQQRTMKLTKFRPYKGQHMLLSLIHLPVEVIKEVVATIGPRIQKRDSVRTIDEEHRVLLALHYLSQGPCYRGAAELVFDVAHNSISGIVTEFCEAVIDEYAETMVKTPTTPQEWLKVARRFDERWQIRALGAIDGKHFAIKKPAHSGSMFHNYKGHFSHVMLALVDADYRFLWVDSGNMGSNSDAQIFNGSDLRENILKRTLGIPDDDYIKGDTHPEEKKMKIPYFILGDDAFALTEWLVKPFVPPPSTLLPTKYRISNYRISRGRRVVENAFGILVSIFRALLKRQDLNLSNCVLAVKACICLYNLILERKPAYIEARSDRVEAHGAGEEPGEWRARGEYLVEGPIPVKTDEYDSALARVQRDYLSEYFNCFGGAVEWQERAVRFSKNQD